MTHLARSIAPLKLYTAATAHDLQTRQTYTGLLNLGEISDEKWMQATLPIKHGGFGVTSVREISQFAFISSWSHTLSVLPTRFPIMEKIVNDLIFQNDTDTSIALEIHQALPSDKSLSELLQKPKQLQRRLTQQHMTSISSYMIEHSCSPRDAARLHSLKGKGAGAWIAAIPESANFALQPYEFRLACLLRLGLEIPAVSCIEKCECDANLDNTGYHLLTCKKGGGPVWSHDSIVSEWSDCLRHLQIHHKREPRDRYTDNNNRPDIAVFDAGSGTNVELDVALAHPWAKDTLFQASKREAAAAANRENRKLTKYSQVTLPGASSLTLVPLVFEHFGHWGERATRYLQELSTRSTDDDGNKNANEFMCYWRKRFSTALQRCNARTIAGKLSHLLSMSSSNEWSGCKAYKYSASIEDLSQVEIQLAVIP
ncbi:uncharacterized protein LOC134196821 [Corticium candelabrum]|uniref:uncharacterized protein LOC134196821 n=1 Tax=Corticium candelabrum TaxID=121492 RepID=UPI002E276E83|nr:uncharacterized protein LOC134196821 [Corticium candelabrum]